MEINHNIKIQSSEFGELLNETFDNPVQFKLFLKLIHGCMEMKEDLTFFNGVDFFVHIPNDKLRSSIITTKTEKYTLSDHIKNKSKIEALQTK